MSETQPGKFCAAITAGVPSAESIPLALSKTHASVRFFSSNASYLAVDQALVASVKDRPLDGDPDLLSYASHTVDICLLDAKEQKLSEARVEEEGGIVVIHPGSGPLVIHPSLRAAIIDLRNLPNVDGLEQVLVASIAAVSSSPMLPAERRVRKHSGMTDEVFSKDNVYKNDVASLERPAIEGTYDSDLPVVVITGEIMPPAAAEFALNLRLKNRAWLAGSPVSASVAESSWQAVGTKGLTLRTGEFLNAGKRWPDQVAPDILLADLNSFIENKAIQTHPAELSLDEGTRPRFMPMEPFGNIQPRSDAQTDLRAALIVSHGTVSRFFPQYESQKADIDARFLEVLNTIDKMAKPDPRWSRNALRRFGESLKDGHNFVYNSNGNDFVGVLPIVTETINGKAVIRRSGVPGIHPGDTIEAWDGRSMDDWFTEELARTSGDTLGYRYDLASRELITLLGPISLTLLAPDGIKRSVVINPDSGDAYMKLHPGTPVLRPSGWLGDVKAPEVYYINMASDITKDLASFETALQEAKSAKGLVIDMRGYPNGDHYEMVSRLICQPFHSPYFHTPTYLGPNSRDIDVSQMDLQADTSAYCGPIVLLVGPHSVSAAENFSTMLVDAKRVTVIGQQSAGTNGNITGVQLPGGFSFTFTGMEVRHADGARFKGLGIVPDVLVEPTVEDLASGKDRALAVAAERLQH